MRAWQDESWGVGRRRRGFASTDLLGVLAAVSVLGFVGEALRLRVTAKSHLGRCVANLQPVNRAVLQYALDHGDRLPRLDPSPAPGGWWWYKELVKGYTGLTGESSSADTLFACPDDRGYGDGPGLSRPFWRSQRHDYTSYVFNGVTLEGVPNLAGRAIASVTRPGRALLTMEWTAHAPLSWHRSRTGRANTPFYCDAESVTGFVDGHVAFTRIYYDGLNAAYTRDPVPGYSYTYSGD